MLALPFAICFRFFSVGCVCLVARLFFSRIFALFAQQTKLFFLLALFFYIVKLFDLQLINGQLTIKSITWFKFSFFSCSISNRPKIMRKKLHFVKKKSFSPWFHCFSEYFFLWNTSLIRTFTLKNRVFFFVSKEKILRIICVSGKWPGTVWLYLPQNVCVTFKLISCFHFFLLFVFNNLWTTITNHSIILVHPSAGFLHVHLCSLGLLWMACCFSIRFGGSISFDDAVLVWLFLILRCLLMVYNFFQIICTAIYCWTAAVGGVYW